MSNRITKFCRQKLPVFVVNLARSPERRDFMADQLHGFGVDFSIFEAVDGQKMTKNERSHYSIFRSLLSEGRALSQNEVGCALTHARIYQKIVNENYQEALILEDDVSLSADFFHILENRHKLPPDWELVNFRSTARKQVLDNSISIWKHFKVCRFLQDANGTVAYYIRYQGAKKILDHIYPIRYPADGILGRTKITGLVSYGIDPEPVSLADFPSEIWGNYQNASWNQPHWRFTMRWTKKFKRILKRMGFQWRE